MNLKQGFLIEVKQETDRTRRIVSNVTDEHFDWRPHPKSMTLGELVGHVIELHSWVANGLSVEDFDLATMYQPFKPASVAEALQHLDVSFEENLKFINNSTEEDWAASWKMRFGDYVIAELPKAGAFRFIIQHHIVHHRGQLSVYLRLLDIPVPGLFGPSADERQ